MKRSTATQEAIEAAREFAPGRAQRYTVGDPMFAIMHGVKWWRVDPDRDRTLAPRDLAEALPVRLARALGYAVKGWGVSTRAYNKLARIGLVLHHDVAGRTTRRRITLSTYGRAVAWHLGHCTHDAPAAAEIFEFVIRPSGRPEATVRRETEICPACGSRRAAESGGGWDAWRAPAEWEAHASHYRGARLVLA